MEAVKLGSCMLQSALDGISDDLSSGLADGRKIDICRVREAQIRSDGKELTFLVSPQLYLFTGVGLGDDASSVQKSGVDRYSPVLRYETLSTDFSPICLLTKCSYNCSCSRQ